MLEWIHKLLLRDDSSIRSTGLWRGDFCVFDSMLVVAIIAYFPHPRIQATYIVQVSLALELRESIRISTRATRWLNHRLSFPIQHVWSDWTGCIQGSHEASVCVRPFLSACLCVDSISPISSLVPSSCRSWFSSRELPPRHVRSIRGKSRLCEPSGEFVESY